LALFIVNEDDTVEHLQVEQYERLLRRDPGEKLSIYAGKRLRYASVVIDSAVNDQIDIIQIQYCYLIFDAESGLKLFYNFSPLNKVRDSIQRVAVNRHCRFQFVDDRVIRP
jgi:hypothetical protein